jgi:hypothetical protein
MYRKNKILQPKKHSNKGKKLKKNSVDLIEVEAFYCYWD